MQIDTKLVKPALTYLPAFVGAAVWGFARHPDKLTWASDLYGRSFGTIAGLYEEWTKLEGYGEPLDAALEELRTIPRTILDLATGTGYVARLLKRKFPEAEVTGTDISEEMVGVAQHNALGEGLQIGFERADGKDLPFADGRFDLVVLQNSIVYPEEMMRVVAPGGRALIAYSFAGPWVKLAWPALASKLEDAGAEHTWGDTRGMGFFGVARKAGAPSSIRSV